MNKYDVVVKYIKDIKPNYSKHHPEEQVRADQLRRNFHQQGWVTDITYLTKKETGKERI